MKNKLIGWAIQIEREDGSTFLACSGTGDVPAIWCNRNRKYAVIHKKKLIENELKCKIVPVQYFEPVILETP